MEDDRKQTLDLEKEYPFPRYQAQDEWIKYRRDIDSNEESTGWGED